MTNTYSIKFEKRKSEQYLTISCIIKNTEKIKDIQDELWDKFNGKLEKVKSVENKEGLYPENEKDLDDFIIYKYPLDRLHFSLFVISTKNIVDYLKFEETANVLKREGYFKELKEEIIKISKEISADKNIIKKGQIKRIYCPDCPEKIENSIALNIYMPGNFKHLKEIEKKIKTKLEHLTLDGEIKLKMFNEEYFAINLIRFIHKQKDDCFKESTVYEKIEKINKRLIDNHIEVEFEIKPTISDPFLANKEPFLDE